MSRPTYEQVAELVAAQAREITELRAHIAEQDARIAELERQFSANSRNCSKPPSTDGLTKPSAEVAAR